MIRYTCPTCRAILQAPNFTVGIKVGCPKCGQRLIVPNPVKPAINNKTVLGRLAPVSNGSVSLPSPELRRGESDPNQHSLNTHSLTDHDLPFGLGRAFQDDQATTNLCSILGCLCFASVLAWGVFFVTANVFPRGSNVNAMVGFFWIFYTITQFVFSIATALVSLRHLFKTKNWIAAASLTAAGLAFAVSSCMGFLILMVGLTVLGERSNYYYYYYY